MKGIIISGLRRPWTPAQDAVARPFEAAVRCDRELHRGSEVSSADKAPIRCDCADDGFEEADTVLLHRKELFELFCAISREGHHPRFLVAFGPSQLLEPVEECTAQAARQM